MKGTLLAIFLVTLSLAYGFRVHPTRCETFGLSKYAKASPAGEELVGISQHYLFSHAQGFSFIGELDLFDGNNSIVEMGFSPEFYKSFKEFPVSNSKGRLDRDEFISSPLDVVGSASFVYNTHVDISEGVNFLAAYIITENPVNSRPDLAWFEGQDWQHEYYGALESNQGKYIAVECEKGWEYCEDNDVVHIHGRSLGSFGSGNPIIVNTPHNHTCGYKLAFGDDGFSHTALTFQIELAHGDFVIVSTKAGDLIAHFTHSSNGVQKVIVSDAAEIYVDFRSESEQGHGFHAIYERISGTEGSCFTALENTVCNDYCLVSFVTGGFVEGFIDTHYNWASCQTQWSEQCALAAEFAVDIQFCTVPEAHATRDVSMAPSTQVQRTYDFYVSQ